MISIKKGLDLPISGTPVAELSDTPVVRKAAILGNDYIGMKPTLLAREGDRVKVGQKIIEDKKNPGVFFTSPCGGTISDINRGEKRKFLSLEIEIDSNEEFVEFDTTQSPKDLLINSGLFNSFRTRPFNRTPRINDTPDCIFINACDTNPLAISPHHIISLNKDEFDAGVNFISSLFSTQTHLTYQDNILDYSYENVESHMFSGPHPAGLVSTHISAIYPVDINRCVWTIGYQEVISIGYLLKNNILRTHKNIAITGESVFKPSLLSSRIGANLEELTAGKIEDNSRIISGSVLFGHDAIDAMSYLGFYDNQVSVISNIPNDIFYELDNAW